MSYLKFVLRACLPEKNINRVYEVFLNKGLFESWIVMTAYGRFGSGTHQKIYSFMVLDDAKKFVRKILKKRLNAEKRVGCNYTVTKSSSSDSFAEERRAFEGTITR